MADILAARLATRRRFPPGEELLLALGVATSDLGALSVAVLERFHLTHTQYNVLRMVAGAADRGLTHAEITRWMVTGVPDVTRLIDRLEERGLVRRERDPSDRRRVTHRIRPRGLELLGSVQPEMSALHEWIEEQIPPARRRTLVELCEEVIEVAAKRSGREIDG